MTVSEGSSGAVLIAHMESHLGRIDAGWTSDADGLKLPFQVVRFPAPSLSGCVAFSTLGLSHTPMSEQKSGRTLRLELMMIVREELAEGLVPGLLQQVALEMLKSGEPLLRGHVVGPRGPLFDGSTLEALYASSPSYLPREFASSDGTAIVWLVPISSSEAAFVASEGWPDFEDQLVEVDPDLTDIGRLSIFGAQ